METAKNGRNQADARFTNVLISIMFHFCGLCNEFTCDWLTKKVTWNPNVVEHLRNLAITYKEQNNEECFICR